MSNYCVFYDSTLFVIYAYDTYLRIIRWTKLIEHGDGRNRVIIHGLDLSYIIMNTNITAIMR